MAMGVPAFFRRPRTLVLAPLVLSLSLLVDASGDRRVTKDAVDANTRTHLDTVAKLQVKEYSFVSDQFENARFANRRHVGVFAQDLLTVMPDAVAVMPDMRVRGMEGSGTMQLDNFHMIDKERVFWTNIGATQELNHQVTSLHSLTANMTDELQTIEDELVDVQGRLMKEAEKELVELRKTREAEARIEEAKVEQERVRGDEARKTEEFKAKQEAANVEYNDRLARERQEREDNLAKRRNEDLVNMQADANREQEALRMDNERTLEEMRTQSAMSVAEIEKQATIEAARVAAEARIRQQRENEDIDLRAAAQQAQSDREKLIEAVKTSFRLVGEGIAAFLTSPSQLISAGLFLGLSGLLLFVGRETAKVLAEEVARRLKRPALLRESSRDDKRFSTFNQLLQLPARIRRRLKGAPPPDPFQGIVLRPELRTKLNRLATSISNARRHGAPMRHFLFYGAPGTGKTMTAKQLARRAGLDYAIMTGGDVVPLGKQGVTELHKVFRWAKASPRGLLLFIDEAEAFLGSRNSALSESLRNAVSAILYHTGEQQSKFMMVLATNRPGDLDMAVADRIDEALFYQKPSAEGRALLFQLYFNKYLASRKPKRCHRLCGRSQAIEIADDIDEEVMKVLASKTKDFSGREIAKMMLAMQSHVYGLDVPKLNRKDMLATTEQLFVDQRKKWELLQKKVTWS